MAAVSFANSLVVKAYNSGKIHEFNIREYKPSRSNAQNRLQHHWNNELDRVKDRIPEISSFDIDQIRAFNKLRFGVPIMKEDQDFFEAWQLAAANLNHEQRMQVVFYMPVTSLMNVEQKARFLNAVYYFYQPKGAELTTSDDFYFEAMGWTR
jgi:hypothetical protein